MELDDTFPKKTPVITKDILESLLGIKNDGGKSIEKEFGVEMMKHNKNLVDKLRDIPYKKNVFESRFFKRQTNGGS